MSRYTDSIKGEKKDVVDTLRRNIYADTKKLDIVQNLTEKISKAKAMILTDYRGIKHKDLENIRKLLKKIKCRTRRFQKHAHASRTWHKS